VIPADEPAEAASASGGAEMTADPTSGDGDGDGDGAIQRAERLLRWYPRPWRDRYGAEFTELLVSEISERPRSLRRSLDVARGGIRARLADAGLTGFPLPLATAASAATSASTPEQARQRQVSASLGAFSCALGGFLVFGSALWSQLLISWQFSVILSTGNPAASPLRRLPQTPGDDAFLVVFTTGAMLVLLVLAVLAALPVVFTVSVRIARGREPRLIRPAIVLAASLFLLLAGGRHFENNWLGTGGHHALIPSGLAAFIWAVTLFVSSYWGHPTLLATLPVGERVWMALSPLVLAAAVASAAVLVRRARLSSRVAAFEAGLGLLACVTMAAVVACYGVWIAARVRLHPDLPAGISVGATNATIIALLVVALAVAAQAARMAVRGLRRARA
jgi:hypothetical protein